MQLLPFYVKIHNPTVASSHSGCCASDFISNVVAVMLQAVAVVTALQQREGFKGVPLYALGASSGGAFALALAAHLPLSGTWGRR